MHPQIILVNKFLCTTAQSTLCSVKTAEIFWTHIFQQPFKLATKTVVWMEKEFDAYKLSRCMCPPNYNRFWDRARYLWQNHYFIIPLAFDAPIRGFPSEYRHPVWYGKTRMVGLPDGEKIEDIYNGLDTIPVCDRQTDGYTDILPRHICAVHTRRAVKMDKESWICILFLTVCWCCSPKIIKVSPCLLKLQACQCCRIFWDPV